MWQPVYTASTNRSGESFLINQTFTSRELIVEALLVNQVYRYIRLGNLQSVYSVTGVGLVRGKRAYVRRGTQKIVLENTETPYSLEFYLNIWVLEIKLRIWEYTGQSINLETVVNKLDQLIILLSTGQQSGSPFNSASTFNSPSNSSFTGLI